ncbi:peptidoglycan-binding domain-containing protein [Streptomyces sp. NPDC002054]|uniref:peptidoglycan-binding domain-containing protein n=1 Tax=Streptomyces sp. NPDC002054 TaxID=3154663 RepID=UPI003328BB6E
MSHPRDPGGPVAEDGPLVRPYAPAGPGHPAPAGSWPPPVPEPAPLRPPVPPVSPYAAARGSRRREPARRRSRTPLLFLGLTAVAVTAGLLLLLPSQEPGRPKAVEPPPLSGVPGLPGGGGADADPTAPTSAGTGTSGPAATRPATSPPSTPPTPSKSPSATGGATAQPTPSPGRPDRSGATLRTGATGPEVETLQQALFGQGFTYVSVTGVYDDDTKRGVKQFQRDRSLRGDPAGVFGPATRAALYGS